MLSSWSLQPFAVEVSQLPEDLVAHRKRLAAALHLPVIQLGPDIHDAILALGGLAYSFAADKARRWEPF